MLYLSWERLRLLYNLRKRLLMLDGLYVMPLLLLRLMNLPWRLGQTDLLLLDLLLSLLLLRLLSLCT